ncbi:carbohydrate ABC transporter permease [Vibrio renipiscarius]|uniref:Sugar ABC transporter permease n=1 Tax=Vibrio renipiscarius TaxID=1461322 RepID=A0A0C2NGT2_9VIBR|nr:sugar ABC transporter permease [Vibrio renipiscarius]KII75319.1 sugar ABC transporter permease [Vibrio renipiscarius]KII78771.1 sugar ABC transporter permease [Vibrio renipiscarius]
MSTVTISAPKTSSAKKYSYEAQQKRYGWMMGAPAFFGLIMFIVVPFVMAITMTFTNQRMMSPNPTEMVGLSNYERLLSVNYLIVGPNRNENGESKLNRKGEVEYPRLRTLIRTLHPELKGYYELISFTKADDSKLMILAKDPIFYKSLWNTLLFALMVVPLQGGTALGLALLVNQGLKGTNFFRTVYFAPVVTSMVVVSIVWIFLYHKDAGLINEYLRILTFGAIGPIDWLGDKNWAMPSVVIMSSWQGAGVQMLIFLAGLQGIPKDLYEAASIDGANAWQKFRYITIPGLKNTMVFIVISTTIAAFGLFTQVDVMTNGGPQDSTTTVMYHLVQKGFREMDTAYGSTISVIYFVIILSIAMFQKRIFDKKDAK